jgi:hypothetical protein
LIALTSVVGAEPVPGSSMVKLPPISSVIGPEPAVPIELPLPSWRKPPETSTGPESVLAVVSVKVPLPAFVKLPVPKKLPAKVESTPSLSTVSDVPLGMVNLAPVIALSMSVEMLVAPPCRTTLAATVKVVEP